MRRHDLNAPLIEGVLDALVQVRIGLDHFLGLIRIDIQFIGYIKIVEGFFLFSPPTLYCNNRILMIS